MVAHMLQSRSAQQLKFERLRRGWSRSYIAEQTGIADPKTVGRWERGEARPGPASLQRLCALFSLTPCELGFPFPSTPTSTIQHTSYEHTAIHDPTIPYQLFETDGIIGRDTYTVQIKHLLLQGTYMNRVALYGLPGIGKTAIALAQLQDEDVTQHFADGVLWASLGKQPDLLAHLQRWGTLLAVDTGKLPDAGSIYHWTRALKQVIGMRRILFVIDDVWSYETALALTVGGPNCAYIITTRLPALARQFANNKALPITTLDEATSMNLLAHFVPEIAHIHVDQRRSLVSFSAGLPLALVIMGKYLQTHAYGTQPRRLQNALKTISSPQERMRYAIAHPYFGQKIEGQPIATGSLQESIALSYQALNSNAQQTLVQLAAITISTQAFSEEAVVARCAMAIEDLDELVDVGLLQNTGINHYTIHQTIADFASLQIHEPTTQVADNDLTAQTNATPRAQSKRAAISIVRSPVVSTQQYVGKVAALGP